MSNIIHDDAYNLAKYVPNNSIDLIIWDPPYGVGDSKLDLKNKNWKKSSEKWDKFDSIEDQVLFYASMLDIFEPLLKPEGNIVTFGSFHNIYLIGYLIQTRGWKIVNSIVFDKINAMFNVTHSSLIEGCEHMIWASPTGKYYFDYDKSKTYTGGKQLRNVWRNSLTPNSERVGHPHQKPIWLYKRIISITCPENGVVLDPMAGSGTTCIACECLDREYISVERSDEYFAMMEKRLNKYKRTNTGIFD